MDSIKKLANQTAIYGGSTILVRCLNFLLVPLHVYLFAPAEYGMVSELYAYAGIFAVILTYGMETAYFRFAQSEGNRVFSTAIVSLLATSLPFMLLGIIFSNPIAAIIDYGNHPEYITWFSLTLGLDAMSALFFSQLRIQNRPVRFAALKTINIVTNVLFNLFFLLLCPYLTQYSVIGDFISSFYNPQVGAGYIFIANLIASMVTFVIFIPNFLKISPSFDGKIWRKMVKYALPLLIMGLAGTVNEMVDRIFLRRLSPAEIAQSQVGIYSACYKIAILMTLFIQAFRYAAEPYFFNKSKDKDAKENYANICRIFVLTCSFIFIITMLYMDVIQYFIPSIAYHVGLPVVPILLMANLCLGVFYNLSIWYKLTDKTRFGAYIALIGAAITILLNYCLIPYYGYMASAWATLCCYAAMMVISYFLGQKYYPVQYNVAKIGFYAGAALAIYLLSTVLPIENFSIKMLINSLLLLIYITIIIVFDKEYLISQFKSKKRG